MKLSEEDKREYLIVWLICVGLFLFWSITPVNALVAHEALGHGLTCSLQGGTYQISREPDAHVTKCRGVENWSGQQAFNFYLAGMGAEVLLGLFFLSLPLISPFGAFIFLKFVWNLITGSYATDIAKASEILPAMSLLKNPVVQVMLFAIGILLFIASLYYTRRVVRKLNIPFI